MYNNNFNQAQGYTPPYMNTFQSFYNQTPQQNTATTTTTPQVVVRNVNNYEEAKSMSVDFYNTFLLLDFNNSSIYLKKINNNGLEEFYTFRQTANPLDRFQLFEQRFDQRLANIEQFLLARGEMNEPNESSNVSNTNNTSTTAKSKPVSKVPTNDSK